MQGDRRCERCAQLLPPGQSECPRCALEASALGTSRERVIAASAVVLALVFVLTGAAARWHHLRVKHLGEQWYARGETALRAGDSAASVEDFRTALAYERDNTSYRLRLALALAAAGRREEARAHLLRLWEREPGNGVLNLELARLAGPRNNVADALRYYHNAIYGAWERDAEQRRRGARFELVQFLLARGQQREALGELLALAGALPADAAVQLRAAALFEQAGDHARALQQYRRVLLLDRRNGAALIGAGRSAFEQQDYRLAANYLARAVRADPRNSEARRLHDLAVMVVEIDPFDAHLGTGERARRAAVAYAQAMSRAQACAAVASGELQSAYEHAQQLERTARLRSLRANPDRIPTVMDAVFGVERIAERQCAKAEGLDAALLLLAARHGPLESKENGP